MLKPPGASSEELVGHFLPPRGPRGERVAAGTGPRVAIAAERRGHLQACGPQRKAAPAPESQQGQNWRKNTPSSHFSSTLQSCWVFPVGDPSGRPGTRCSTRRSVSRAQSRGGESGERIRKGKQCLAQ